MKIRGASLGILAGCLCFGADKQPPSGQISNAALDIRATVYADKDEMQKLLGEPMEEGVVVVEVRLQPKDNKSLKIDHDDFLLRSDKDGQKSHPFAPSQIAGSAVLVVSSTGGGAAIMGDDRGPVWGGIGGPPRRMGGDGGAIGNTSQDSAQATIRTGEKGKENPLLAVLREKILDEKEITEPVSGLLYFPLEGKHKPKDLELYYNGPAGKLSLRFKK